MDPGKLLVLVLDRLVVLLPDFLELRRNVFLAGREHGAADFRREVAPRAGLGGLRLELRGLLGAVGVVRLRRGRPGLLRLARLLLLVLVPLTGARAAASGLGFLDDLGELLDGVLFLLLRLLDQLADLLEDALLKRARLVLQLALQALHQGLLRLERL